MSQPIIDATVQLFGDLWHRYDDTLFEESVALFAQRFAANGFDLGWFRGTRCLDAGCGGGRYAVALARAGARVVLGCDISVEGLRDARRRVGVRGAVRFAAGSVLELPLVDGAFDFVCCSGVLHHTEDPERGLRELARVLRPGGRLFLLLYGAGGLRWPTVLGVRPHARALGYARLDAAMRRTGLPANKQRTFLDDFFVPILRFYEWGEVQAMLERAGFRAVERWELGKLDHEESVAAQRAELEQMGRVFETLLEPPAPEPAVVPPARAALAAVRAALERLDAVDAEVARGAGDETWRRCEVFGWGHHRVLAERG